MDNQSQAAQAVGGSFGEQFEATRDTRLTREGQDLVVEVVTVNDNYVVVNAALKSFGRIPTEEFHDHNGVAAVKEGDMVEVEIELLDNGNGETVLSRRNVRRKLIWQQIENAMENNETVEGVVQSRVRGGFTVAMDGLRAFLPGSLADIFPNSPSDDSLIGQTLAFKPIKVNRRRNSVVLSRRAALEPDMLSSKDKDALNRLNEGDKVMSKVRAIVDYGAFLEIAEHVFGLLHITDISWKHTTDINSVMKIGDEVETVILKLDRERGRVSLGRKQLQPDPWQYVERSHPVGSRAFGKVTRVLEYGVFVEIDDELQGLVHSSEMSWTKRNVNPSKMVEVGDEVEVQILEIDRERLRISLGMKQCKSNPWQEFATAYRKGDVITCKVHSISEYGIFMELPGDIEGLVWLGDISWDEKPQIAAQKYRRGQEVQAMILNIDPERERIGLSIKQLENKQFEDFCADNLSGALLAAVVTSVEDKGAVMKLTDSGLSAFLPISEISETRVESVGERLRVGQECEVALINADVTKHRILVSLKAKHRQAQQRAMQQQKANNEQATTKLGALLQAKIQEQKEEAGDE